MDDGDDDLKAQLEAARAENRLLRAAIQASPAGILVAGAPDGVIRIANPAALGIRGRSAEELVEIPLELHPSRWQTFNPDGSMIAPEELPLSRALLKGEVIDGQEVIIRDHEGRERWVLGHSAPVRDAAGQIVAAVVVFPDVTERKHAEQRAERFLRMAELSSDLIGLAAPDGRALYVNATGLALCGFPADTQVEALNVRDFHPAEVGDMLGGTAFPAAVVHGSWTGESTLLARSGEQIPVSQLIIAHRDASGAPSYFSTVMRDLRPLRSLEAQLAQSQRLESIGRLAGGIAHDFNNLLTVITNYVELVRATQQPGSRIFDDLGEVQAASERAAALCRGLLGFARRQPIAPEVVDLNHLIADFSKLLSRLIGESIELVFNPQADLWRVKIDRSQFEQILVNLAVNARDAMPAGGKLTIQTLNASFDAGGMKAPPDMTPGDWVGMTISDTGVGMSEAVQSRVFEPFFSTKPSGAGFGLGLATVHGAIRQNDGQIFLESSPGSGTRVTVWLPRTHDAVAVPEKDSQPAPARSGGLIMLVEDRADIRALTTRILIAAGFEVTAASSGEEALTLWPSVAARARLLLTDIVMPGISGRQLAARIRDLAPELPVLLMSGYSEPDAAGEASVGGRVEFLAKPFTPSVLLAKVASLLA